MLIHDCVSSPCLNKYAIYGVLVMSQQLPCVLVLKCFVTLLWFRPMFQLESWKRKRTIYLIEVSIQGVCKGMAQKYSVKIQWQSASLPLNPPCINSLHFLW